MILIIGEDEKKLENVVNKVKEICDKDDRDIRTVVEISRILVPMSKDERAYLYDYGRKAKELAQEADAVYLYRDKLVRLK